MSGVVRNHAQGTCLRDVSAGQCPQCGRWASERCALDDEEDRAAYDEAMGNALRARGAATITPARVLELKAEAKQLKLQQGLKQSAALAQIARREGFTSWPALMAAAGGRQDVDEARWDNPTIAQVARAERHQERMRRYGDAS